MRIKTISQIHEADRWEAAVILADARRRIQRGWTTGAWARDSERRPVDLASSEACSFCLTGALKAACELRGPHPQAQSWDAVFVLAYYAVYATNPPTDRTPYGGLTGFNDAPGRNKYEVVQALDRAIDLAGHGRLASLGDDR
ncbi:DUF6197 family protein [Candidatus Poriferisocius sp.]|uniref:DUF6197 family protein n=1 Tax=Candidatus Poriferisocius sp. TaxID=3101276 RepID=UPI003B020C10